MVCFFLSCLFGTRGRNLKSIFFFFSFLLFFKTENHASQCNLRWVSQSGEHGNWEGFQTLTQIQVCSHHPGLLYCFTNFPSCSRSGGCHAVGPGAPPAAQRELWPAKAHTACPTALESFKSTDFRVILMRGKKHHNIVK